MGAGVLTTTGAVVGVIAMLHDTRGNPVANP
jgi:hypothetical protein